MNEAKNVELRISADLAAFFDAALESRKISADVTPNESGSRTYTFPAGVTQAAVLEAMEEAYTRREAEKQ